MKLFFSNKIRFLFQRYLMIFSYIGLPGELFWWVHAVQVDLLVLEICGKILLSRIRIFQWPEEVWIRYDSLDKCRFSILSISLPKNRFYCSQFPKLKRFPGKFLFSHKQTTQKLMTFDFLSKRPHNFINLYAKCIQFWFLFQLFHIEMVNMSINKSTT